MTALTVSSAISARISCSKRSSDASLNTLTGCAIFHVNVAMPAASRSISKNSVLADMSNPFHNHGNGLPGCSAQRRYPELPVATFQLVDQRAENHCPRRT
jgi:hypothetical protein